MDLEYIPVYTLGMFLSRMIQALDQAKIRYVLVGGYAVALHGALRGTVDLDFVIALTLPQYTGLASVMKQFGLVSRLPVTAEEIFNFRTEYINNRNLIAWAFRNEHNPLELVNIIITHDADKMQTTTKSIGNQVIRLATIDELIAMKRLSNRPQDREDSKALEFLL